MTDSERIDQLERQVTILAGIVEQQLLHLDDGRLTDPPRDPRDGFMVCKAVARSLRLEFGLVDELAIEADNRERLNPPEAPNGS